MTANRNNLIFYEHATKLITFKIGESFSIYTSSLAFVDRTDPGNPAFADPSCIGVDHYYELYGSRSFGVATQAADERLCKYWPS